MKKLNFLEFKLSNFDKKNEHLKNLITIKTSDIIAIEQTEKQGRIKIFVNNYIWYVDADYQEIITAWKEVATKN